jgi:hypothetical protein
MLPPVAPVPPQNGRARMLHVTGLYTEMSRRQPPARKYFRTSGETAGIPGGKHRAATRPSPLRTGRFIYTLLSLFYVPFCNQKTPTLFSLLIIVIWAGRNPVQSRRQEPWRPGILCALDQQHKDDAAHRLERTRVIVPMAPLFLSNKRGHSTFCPTHRSTRAEAAGQKVECPLFSIPVKARRVFPMPCIVFRKPVPLTRPPWACLARRRCVEQRGPA